MRRLLLLLLLALPLSAANVTFVAPLPGAQAIGPQALEVTTDAANVDRVEFYIDGALAGVARKAPYRIAADFGTSPLPREVVAKVWSNGFRNSDTARVVTAALTAGENLNVDLVEVPLRVRASRPVKASDLRLRENGKEQAIRDVRAERPAAHFVFIVDRSLSMRDGRLTAALAAIDAELGQLRPGDTSSVILFNHVVARPRRIARGERLGRLFAEVSPSGGTSLRDAVASIASHERTYAIVITDGGDRNSLLNDESALRRISSTKTILSAITLGDASPFLEKAASNTGGTIADASAGTIRVELARILQDINSRYLVVYQSSNAAAQGWRTIAIAPAKGVTVTAARKGYWAE
ncbi:MAG TPA: Ig-like domain-containing protein [Thermoanaerobaculia bacterium]